MITGSHSGGLDFSALLNPAQLEAVTTVHGPVLVVAGAGSGKTRTLVHRVAYLVAQGVPPETILLLTFTRKAAAEMLTRARDLVGEGCALVAGGTFHSLANEILRGWADRIGYEPDYGVMDRADMERDLGELRKDLKLGEKDKRFPKRGTLATIISKAANKARSIDDLMVDEYIHLMDYAEDIKKLRAAYAEYKLETRRMDFDDLLLNLGRLLTEDEEARRTVAGRFQYIMVDEYQDTNPVQAEIVYQLGSGHNNVMAVGDDAQSIYAFRGASFRNIMEFPRRFPGTRVIRLEENYRSSQPILDLTNHIISRAREKYDKALFTRREGGRRPVLAVTATQKEQSLYVCDRVRRCLDEGMPPSRIAVLFRAAGHSFDLELELMRMEVDFVKYGGRKFLESAHVKDLLALLKVVRNPKDAPSLLRALLLMDGVGPKTAAAAASRVDGRRENLARLGEALTGKAAANIKPLAELMAGIAPSGAPLADRVQKAWDFYRPVMENIYDDWPKRMADVNELLRIAGNYRSLDQFLADVTLEPPNALNPRGRTLADKLVLSTIHSAKGLEWKVVFIIGASEGRFPAPYVQNKPDELEEERRLMYVAATRAEDELHIVCPLEASFDGGASPRPAPSRFIADVPPGLLESGREEARPQARAAPAAEPPPVASGAEEDGLSPGRRVSHPVFGLGRVLRRPDGKKIKIDFDHFGVKTLHIDYAGLKSAG